MFGEGARPSKQFTREVAVLVERGDKTIDPIVPHPSGIDPGQELPTPGERREDTGDGRRRERRRRRTNGASQSSNELAVLVETLVADAFLRRESDQSTKVQIDESSQSPVTSFGSPSIHLILTAHSLGNFSASTARLVLLPLLSLTIMLTQVLILVFVISESATKGCDAETQDGCRQGEYCSLSFAGALCNDCAAVLPETTQCCPGASGGGEKMCPSVDYTFNHTYVEPSTGIGYFGACAMLKHCIDHDTMPHRCDYLVHALDSIKGMHIYFILFASCMYVILVADELDQADVEVAFLFERASFVRSATRRWLSIGFACLQRLLRKRVVPCANLAATAAVILTAAGKESLSGLSIILNFLAMGFVLEVDDLIVKLFVSNDNSELVSQGVAEALSSSSVPSLREPLQWMNNRMACTVMATYLTMTVILIEPCMAWLMPLADTVVNPSGVSTSVLACNRVVGTVLAGSMLLQLIIAIGSLAFPSPLQTAKVVANTWLMRAADILCQVALIVGISYFQGALSNFMARTNTLRVGSLMMRWPP